MYHLLIIFSNPKRFLGVREAIKSLRKFYEKRIIVNEVIV
jgi:hypothetical protein